MNGWLWVPVAWLLVAAAVTPSSVGKARKPIDGPSASVTVVLQLFLAFCIVYGASR